MGLTAQCVHGVGLCVIPRPANDHRPLALRHRPLALISLGLLLTKAIAITLIGVTPSTAELSTITVNRIVQLTNAERTKAGLNELKVSSLLTNAAQQKGADMLAHDYFAHISPTGVTPWFWINKVGYSYFTAGENLAIDFTEAEDVVAAWMASPSHRENLLLKEYQETGVAVVTGEFQGGTSTVVVHLFGRPATDTPTVSAPTTIKAQPSPSPTPETPRTPRIALLARTATVYDRVALEVAGEDTTTTHFLVNGQARPETIKLDDAGTGRITLDLAGLPDGPVAIRAYSFNQEESELSDPLILTKDTIGPALAKTDVTFIISPMTDRPQAIVRVANATYTQAEIIQGENQVALTAPIPLNAQPVTLALTDDAGNVTTLEDIALAPQFYRDDSHDTFVAPAAISRVSHRFALSVFIIVAFLLSLAIFIRIRIQHAGLIIHASAVLLLALTVFLF